MTVISLAFEFNLKGVLWWQRAVNYILDKGKGSFLGSLFAIKLLECDLHFGLKWAFSWQLRSFVEKHQLYNDSQYALPGKWYHAPTLNKPEEFNTGLNLFLKESTWLKYMAQSLKWHGRPIQIQLYRSSGFTAAILFTLVVTLNVGNNC